MAWTLAVVAWACLPPFLPAADGPKPTTVLKAARLFDGKSGSWYETALNDMRRTVAEQAIRAAGYGRTA